MRYFSFAEFARRCGVSRQRVYQWADEGRIPIKEINGVKRVPETATAPESKKRGRKQHDDIVMA